MTSSPSANPAPKPPQRKKLQAIYHPTRPLSLWQDQQHDQGEVRIEIIPLIDVIFCILTFFILGAVGLSRQQAISLDLPKASTGTPQMREMFVVSLDDLGQLYVEKEPVTQSQMSSALQNYHQYNPNGLIVIHASRHASYNDVVQLLDILREVGGDRVALATLPGDSRPVPSLADPGLGLPNQFPGSNQPPTFPNPNLNPSTIPGTTNQLPNLSNPANPITPNSQAVPGVPQPTRPTAPGSPNFVPGSIPQQPSRTTPAAPSTPPATP